MRLIFIAGPYTADSVMARQENIRQAEKYARALARAGVGFYCPHLNSAHFDGEAPYEFFLAITIETMRRCDCVLAIPGWESSRGARDEVAQARWIGLPVFQPRSVDDLAEVVAWVKESPSLKTS